MSQEVNNEAPIADLPEPIVRLFGATPDDAFAYLVGTFTFKDCGIRQFACCFQSSGKKVLRIDPIELHILSDELIDWKFDHGLFKGQPSDQPRSLPTLGFGPDYQAALVTQFSAGPILNLEKSVIPAASQTQPIHCFLGCVRFSVLF